MENLLASTLWISKVNAMEYLEPLPAPLENCVPVY